jgi:DNA-binding transcriptional regulator GbsR (MarR family)
MQEQSQKTYHDFLATKKTKFKDEFKSKIDEEKQLIYELEQEAQMLEKMEEQCIQELQEVQKEEK